MSEVGKYKLRPPSVEAAPFDDVNDALLTIAKLVGAKSTKIDNATGAAEFTLPNDSVFKVEVGQVVLKEFGQSRAMSPETFAASYEKY